MGISKTAQSCPASPMKPFPASKSRPARSRTHDKSPGGRGRPAYTVRGFSAHKFKNGGKHYDTSNSDRSRKHQLPVSKLPRPSAGTAKLRSTAVCQHAFADADGLRTSQLGQLLLCQPLCLVRCRARIPLTTTK